MKPNLLTSVTAVLVICLTPRVLSQVNYTGFCKGLELTQLDYIEQRDVSKLKTSLKELVGECEYVHGDLVLKDIGIDPNTGQIVDNAIYAMETDFLDSVKEITGRLVLQRLGLREVRLKNLSAIRGAGVPRELGALEVEMCVHPMELLLPSLTAIVQGDVRLVSVIDVGLFCRLNSTVDWTVAFQNPKEQRFLAHQSNCTMNSILMEECTCTPPPTACSSSCPGGRCWSPDVCQATGRCRKRPCSWCYKDPRSGEEECCDPNCIGGCSAPGHMSCKSCAHVSFEGECRGSCPAQEEYNAETSKMVPSSNPMVRVGNVCAKTCPSQFVLDTSRQFCLAACPASETPVEGNCTKCDESNCLVCNSLERTITDPVAAELANCSVWQFQNTVTFDGTSANTSLASWNALGSAKYVFTNSLKITRTENLAANLSVLSSLRYVSGNLVIIGLTTRFLGLSSLEKTKSLMLTRVSELCRGWYPRRHLSSSSVSGQPYRTMIREINFAPDDDPVCTDAACDPQCKECWGPGPSMCVACVGVRVGGVCYPNCRSAGSFENPAFNVVKRAPACLPCHSQCGQDGCIGPNPSECVTCRNFREDGACVSACSSHLEPDANRICYAAATARFAGLAAGLAILVVALLVLGFLGWRYYQRRVHKYDVVELDEYLADPSNPGDMVKLLIVNDDDILKQKEIGSGAFGTVYRGQLRTATVKGVLELPVAIKVLRGNNAKLGQELLNEASVLARVRHPHCVRLVALCLTSEVQLITALMPRGCLLGFLRDHLGGIGAQRMIMWSLQVAEGMAYLESIGIIHRDLAARNVLLKSPDEVKITDFGLARLLQESERQFLYTSGALPVKWLGIECFESGIFSHKSDVWSYGVLLWEICSYGESPYKPYRIASVDDITGLLKKGIRLNQPAICSVDFYNVMLSCWLPYPDSRPTFNDLTATMKDCLLCPSKYMATSADDDEPDADQEKLELLHSAVQHPVPIARGSDKTSYSPMLGDGAAMEPDAKETALMNAAASAAAAQHLNSYVGEPNSPQNRQHQQQLQTNDDYLVPSQPSAPAGTDDDGYLVPGGQRKPVDLDDDYLAPKKC